MRTITKQVFFLSELSDRARERALETMRGRDDIYGWEAESLQSIRAFCNHFGVTLKNHCVGPWSSVEYETDATNANFRGVKLRDIDPENMPTGYCLDCALWQTMHREFKRTGDALHAFDHALNTGFCEWRTDWEYAYSDEQLSEFAAINGCEFNEDGTGV